MNGSKLDSTWNKMKLILPDISPEDKNQDQRTIFYNWFFDSSTSVVQLMLIIMLGD